MSNEYGLKFLGNIQNLIAFDDPNVLKRLPPPSKKKLTGANKKGPSSGNMRTQGGYNYSNQRNNYNDDGGRTTDYSYYDTSTRSNFNMSESTSNSHYHPHYQPQQQKHVMNYFPIAAPHSHIQMPVMFVPTQFPPQQAPPAHDNRNMPSSSTGAGGYGMNMNLNLNVNVNYNPQSLPSPVRQHPNVPQQIPKQSPPKSPPPKTREYQPSPESPTHVAPISPQLPPHSAGLPPHKNRIRMSSAKLI